jgi:hypothetical protein
MTKLRQVCAAAALAATASGTALADKSASLGVMSDYIFRGAWVSDASAYGSIDIEADNGIYLGAWGADIQNGLEYDLYFGYGGGTENVSWNVGFTGYYATDEAFQTQEELNVGFSVGFLSIDYALGDLDPSAAWTIIGGTDNIPNQTYEYLGVTFEPEVGPYYLIGRTDFHNINPSDPIIQDGNVRGTIHGSGAKGMWIEVGKNFELMEGLEIGIAALYGPDVPTGPSDTTPRSTVLSGTNPFAEFAMVMHISKTINFD